MPKVVPQAHECYNFACKSPTRTKMLPNLWKKLFIVATVLLVVSLILGISSWQQLNVIRAQLNDITAQLNAVKPDMESLKAERDQVLSNYASLRNQVNLRLGIRQGGQSFITPDDPEIAARVQEITGGYADKELWKDYGRLFQWVMGNIEYSLDSPTPLLPESIDGGLAWSEDFWRMPAETIRDRAGDCEDVTLLLTSLLLNYNERRFPVWVVGVKTSGSKPAAHIAVAIPSENNQLTIFDIATRYFTTVPNVGGLGSQEIPLAVDQWLTHLEEKLPGAQIHVVFSENLYQEFSSNEEFIDWASKPST